MQNKTSQMKRALRTALLVLLLSVVGMGKMYAQDFTVDNLNYSVNDDGVSVTVTGYLYGYPSWDLAIPSNISDGGNTYSVTSIGDEAFAWCYGLTNITIPNSVTIIGDGAFSACSGLGQIVVETGNATYDSRENCNAIIETCTNTLRAGCKNTTIPNSVTSIGDYAFYICHGLTNITIPNSVTSIGDYAFAECSGLTNITIGNSVTSIGEYAFYNCYRLTNITIPNSVTSIGNFAFAWCEGLTNITIPNSVTSIGNEAFSNCEGLTNITIPNSVTTIGDATFEGCYGLTNITIPNSVTSIGDYAFSGCYGLTNITIPNSVTTIGDGAFAGCGGLGQIVVETGNATYDSREDCNAIIETCTNTLRAGCKNTTIPNSVTSIGDLAFAGCDGLTIITIPNSVTIIGYGAFSACSGLGQIVVETGNAVYDSREDCNAIIETGTNTLRVGCKNTTIPNSVTSIGEYAFAWCYGLTNITIPNSVTSIGDLAFSGCNGLTNITIPNSVTSIGYGAFYGCSGLTNITIGNSVTSIGGHAFAFCDVLTNVTIPNSVTSIGGNAFYDCYGLTNLTIGNSVTSIGYGAFCHCWNLVEVIALGQEPPTLEGGVFAECDCEKLIVCCGSKDAYMASEWANYFGTIEEDCSPHDVTVDEGNMTGGNVSASVSSTELGEEVQLTITPDEGMMLASLTISNANDSEQTVPFYPIGRSTSVYGFIMPPFDVVVTAAFTPNTSVGENSNAEASAYPNPTNGQIKIEAEGLKHITISNMLGQTVYEGKANGDAFEYDFGRHCAGHYLVRIETANGVAVKKVSITQ